MKKILTLVLITLLIVPTVSFATPQTIDLETMSLDELTALQNEIAAAISKASAKVIDGYTMIEDFDEYARNPDPHVDEKVCFNGTIIQVVEGVESTVYRIALDSSSENVFYVTYEPGIEDARFLEDDKVTAMGVFDGLVSYESTLGGTVTIPSLIAEKIVDEVKAETEYAATRDDPAPIGATIQYDGSSYYNECVTDITVTQVVRGDAAWKMVKGFNPYNDKPDSKHEYIIAYVKTKAIKSLDGKAASFSDYDFTFISASGVEYEDPYVSGIKPALQNIYEGAENEGILVGLVEVGDSPLLVYLTSSDNPLWFDLNSSVPIVIDENVVLATLQKGDNNSDVLQLQTKLVEFGYLSGTPDGDFGPKTEAAVKQYQTDMELEATGIADDATLRLILAGQKP